MNPLVSLFCECVRRQIRWTHIHTQDNYSNPHCAHARRGLTSYVWGGVVGVVMCVVYVWCAVCVCVCVWCVCVCVCVVCVVCVCVCPSKISKKYLAQPPNQYTLIKNPLSQLFLYLSLPPCLPPPLSSLFLPFLPLSPTPQAASKISQLEEVCVMVEECDGLDKIESLQQHSN